MLQSKGILADFARIPLTYIKRFEIIIQIKVFGLLFVPLTKGRQNGNRCGTLCLCAAWRKAAVWTKGSAEMRIYMEPLYCETYLNANPTSKRKALRVALMALAVFLVAIGFVLMLSMGTYLPLMVMFLIAAIIVYLLPTTNIAYEYIFVDGQIDFDRILKGEKRKTMMRIDMDKIELVAPEGSHELDSYRQKPLFDYSSGMQGKHYIAVHLGEKGLEQVKFTPDEKMLEAIGTKSPSKLKRQ